MKKLIVSAKYWQQLCDKYSPIMQVLEANGPIMFITQDKQYECAFNMVTPEQHEAIKKHISRELVPGETLEPQNSDYLFENNEN